MPDSSPHAAPGEAYRPRPPKHLAVFFDGTWNSKHDVAEADTNVADLFDLCTLPDKQLKRYLSGPGGLIEEPRSRARRALWHLEARFGAADQTFGGATGLGVTRQIKLAYEFLSSRYEPGDLIYLFGFSRGAFAARSFAGFVELVGLLFRDNLDLLETAFLLYQTSLPGKQSSLRSLLREVHTYDGPSGEALPIYFIGVFDTVASLGIAVAPALTDWYNAFHRTALPRNVTHAQHAVAIHEMRGQFRPVLWEGKTDARQSLVQMLFRGAHADVGGGYFDGWWSDWPMEWMHQEAAALGLPLMNYARPLRSRLAPPAIHCESRMPWRLGGTRNRIIEFDACSGGNLMLHPSAKAPTLELPTDLASSVAGKARAVERWAQRRYPEQVAVVAGQSW